MNGGIRIRQREDARREEHANRCNIVGIVGLGAALAAAVCLAASYWAEQAVGVLLALRIAALVLAAAGTALCGIGAGRAGARRLNGFAFCGLLIGAGVLCCSAPLLVGMLS